MVFRMKLTWIFFIITPSSSFLVSIVFNKYCFLDVIEADSIKFLFCFLRSYTGINLFCQKHINIHLQKCENEDLPFICGKMLQIMKNLEQNPRVLYLNNSLFSFHCITDERTNKCIRTAIVLLCLHTAKKVAGIAVNVRQQVSYRSRFCDAYYIIALKICLQYVSKISGPKFRTSKCPAIFGRQTKIAKQMSYELIYKILLDAP